MARRSSVIEEILDGLAELASTFWQAGVAISLLFAFITFQAFEWASDKRSIVESSKSGLANIFKNVPWIYYVMPSVLGFLTLVFILITFKAYSKSNNRY